MKILIINTVRFRLNGITSVIMNYYRKMDKSNMQIDFVVINEISDDYRSELESHNSNIFYIQRKKNPISYMINLNKIMKENKYDIVHIHGNSALLLLETITAWMAKIPVRIVHSHNTTCTHKSMHNILQPIFKRTYTNGLACGAEAGKWLFGDSKFEIVKNGIDLDLFMLNDDIRSEYREKLKVQNKKVIGHIGNFIYQKNHDFLIDSFNELLKVDDDYMLVLISDGELLEDMKDKVKRLGIEQSVVFLGKTTEANKYLQAMDIFLLPSHYEGLPVVLIEAQALGLPCLVSNNISKEAKITNTVEFLPIDDTSIWVKEIRNQNLDNRKDIVEINHKKIKEAGYDVSKNSNEMKKLYIKYLNEKIKG